jgi:hypothetical protein
MITPRQHRCRPRVADTRAGNAGLSGRPRSEQARTLTQSRSPSA